MVLLEFNEKIYTRTLQIKSEYLDTSHVMFLTSQEVS